MTVLPGSLDYLYYNGILDHIPYEAYEQLPVNNIQGMNPYANLSESTGAYSQYNMQNQFQGVNGSEYMTLAMNGNAYKSYLNSADSFTKTDIGNVSTDQNFSMKEKMFGTKNGIGKDADFEIMANGDEGKSYRESITAGFEKTKSTISNSSTLVKGLVGIGIMAATLILILRGKKKP